MSIGKRQKKLNLRKREMVWIDDDFKLPVRTLSVAEEAGIQLNIPFGIPSKIIKLTEAEKQDIIDSDPKYNEKTYIATKVYDKTSIQYIDYETKKLKFAPLLEGLKYIDFEFEYEDEETKEKMPFYEYLGLTSPDNWLEICEYFDNAGMTQNHLEKIIIAVKKMNKDSVFERLYKIQQITQMDYVTLLSALEEVMDKKQDKKMGIDSSILDQLDLLEKHYKETPQTNEVETFHNKNNLNDTAEVKSDE